MKILTQALDYRNARSVWHRPFCRNLCDFCCGCTLAILVLLSGVAGVVVLAIVLMELVAMLLLRYPADVMVALGLDDHTQIFANLSATAARFNSELITEWTMTRIYWVLVSCIILLSLAALFASLFERQWTGVAGSLVFLLAPVLFYTVGTVACSLVGGLFFAIMGSLFELFVWLNVPRQEWVPTLRNGASIALARLHQDDTGFYRRMAIYSVATGTALGLLAILILCIFYPLYRICSAAHRDVKDTFHELDV
jgi:hypothetical protein